MEHVPVSEEKLKEGGGGVVVSLSTVKNVVPFPFKEEIGRFMQRKHIGKWSNENREAR